MKIVVEVVTAAAGATVGSRLSRHGRQLVNGVEDHRSTRSGREQRTSGNVRDLGRQRSSCSRRVQRGNRQRSGQRRSGQTSHTGIRRGRGRLTVRTGQRRVAGGTRCRCARRENRRAIAVVKEMHRVVHVVVVQRLVAVALQTHARRRHRQHRRRGA